jgi:hypothetical protein
MEGWPIGYLGHVPLLRIDKVFQMRMMKSEGKFHPRTALEGPEGE